jgi:hypothetical protein
MNTKFAKRNPKRFWDWFARHEKEFLNINEENYHKAFYKMYKYLEKFNPYLGFEFIVDSKNGKREFVVTANGNIDLFDTVFSLIDAAPEKLKERWIFTALRQPMADEIVIHFNEMTIESKDIFYELEESETEPGKWDIFVYIKGVSYDSEETEEYLAEALMTLLDGVVGEYTNATKISELILVEKGELENPKNILELRKEINKLDAGE